MALQIRRVTGQTPDPQKISGVTFMLTVNQSQLVRERIIGVEKVGNNFEVMYIHDTADEGQQYITGLRFQDENQNITFGGDPTIIANRYLGKFDLGGVPKHIFLQ